MELRMEKITTSNGVEHGLIEQFSNSVPDHGYKNLNEKNKKEMLAKKEKDLKLVRVRYVNLKNQDTGKWEGAWYDHPGVPIHKFRFIHDNVYVVPYGLYKKINSMGAPLRSGLIDQNGKQLNVDGKMDRTHQLLIEDVA